MKPTAISVLIILIIIFNNVQRLVPQTNMKEQQDTSCYRIRFNETLSIDLSEPDPPSRYPNVFKANSMQDMMLSIISRNNENNRILSVMILTEHSDTLIYYVLSNGWAGINTDNVFEDGPHQEFVGFHKIDSTYVVVQSYGLDGSNFVYMQPLDTSFIKFRLITMPSYPIIDDVDYHTQEVHYFKIIHADSLVTIQKDSWI